MPTLGRFALDYAHMTVGKSLILHADCFEWMGRIPENSIHGIVTDPPYGVKEYEFDQLEKRANGNGGIWRIPPSFDGSTRQPLPRFTALNQREREQLLRFFKEWATVSIHALRPGGHVFIACSSFLCQMVYGALVGGGLEFRGQVIIFRKPIPPGMKVSECLEEFGTGGLRRLPEGLPFNDLIMSERTPKSERGIASHPSLKPQSFLRELVYSVLPLGKGIILDPFMGSGSTIAAAEALGLPSIGVEKHQAYFEMARSAVSRLSLVRVPRDQISLALA